MNWIRKSIFFIGLSLAFIFAYYANVSVEENMPVEKKQSSYSFDHIHSSVFIQPQTNASVVSPHKNPNFSFLKYFENFLVEIPLLKIGKSFKIFSNQDYNHSEMVSRLIFPFHTFW